MHYRGKRVPLSEKSPSFQRAGIPASRSFTAMGTEGKKSFLAWPRPVAEGKRAAADGPYRPGNPGEGSPFYRAPRVDVKPSPRGRGLWGLGPSLRGVLRLAAFGALVVVLLWSKNRTVSLLQDLAGLRLQQVSVEGERYLTQEEVVKALDLPLGESMFKLDLKGSVERVRRMAWVERVFLERRLPRSILVSIKERRPVALLERGDLYGLDAEGRVLPPAPMLLREDLPLVSGLPMPADAVGTTRMAEALRPALDLLAFLQKKDPALAQDVSEINLSEGDTLKVTFMDGLQAKFDPPVSDPELKRMALVVSDLQEKGRKAATMDFRYRNLVLVKARN